MPAIMTVPKTGSFLMPRISSTPSRASTIVWTVTPSMRAAGLFAATDAIMESNAALTPVSERTLSATPPTSVLWVMSGERILSTTG